MHKILLFGNIQPLQHEVFTFNLGDDSLLDISNKSNFHTTILLLFRHSESEEIHIFSHYQWILNYMCKSIKHPRYNKLIILLKY